MGSGYGARIMGALESWGLADARWHNIADVAFARHVAFERDGGGTGRLALCVLLNYAKVKFASAEARPAKFYIKLGSAEVG